MSKILQALSPYELIIFTNRYAGNFEREMGAYCTGMWDRETHGGDQATVFFEEVIGNPFEEYVTTEIDEYGIATPNCIERNSLGKYTGVGIYFSKRPTPELIALLKERAYKFCREGLIFGEPVEKGELRVLSFKLVQRTVVEEEDEV